MHLINYYALLFYFFGAPINERTEQWVLNDS